MNRDDARLSVLSPFDHALQQFQGVEPVGIQPSIGHGQCLL